MKKLLFIMAILMPMPALAQENGPWSTQFDIRAQYLLNHNRDLSSGDNNDSEALEGRYKALYNPSDNFSAFTEIRGGVSSGGLMVDQDTGEKTRSHAFVEAREFWAQWNNVFMPALGFQAGRQRFKEERGLWWNGNLDAMRVFYNTTQFRGFFALGQNLAGYSTDSQNFEKVDQDRFRALAEGSWLVPGGGRAELRGLYEDDYSGAPGAGQVISNDDRDDTDGKLLWLGGRIADRNARSPFSYRADLIGVGGNEDVTASTSAGGGRLIGATTNRDVMGWAFDGQVSYAFKGLMKPSVTLGYAFGSGDEGGSGTDHGFRESGLESNTSFDGGESRFLYNYGDALQPELSNLHIISLGMHLQTSPLSDLNIRYFHYWRDENGTGLRSDNLSMATATADSDIGQEMDVGYNLNVGQAFRLSQPALNNLLLRTSLGAFRSGDAYGVHEGEYMVRGLAELRVSF